MKDSAFLRFALVHFVIDSAYLYYIEAIFFFFNHIFFCKIIIADFEHIKKINSHFADFRQARLLFR